MRVRSRACFRFGLRGGPLVWRLSLSRTGGATSYRGAAALECESLLSLWPTRWTPRMEVIATPHGRRYLSRRRSRLRVLKLALHLIKIFCPEGSRRGVPTKPREGIRDFQASRSAGVRTSRWKLLDMLKFRELCRIPELRQDGGSCILTAAEHFVRTFSAWRRGG